MGSSLAISGVKCPKGCGSWMEFTPDPIGRLVERCPTCPAELTPAQELYRLEKAKKTARVAPVMEAAAVELQRQDDARTAARKGGRPRGPHLTLGARGYGHRRSSEPEPEMPGRPDRLDLPPTRHQPSPPRAEPSMTATRATPVFADKPCRRCARDFTPGGPRAVYCGRDDCEPASAPAKVKAATPPKPPKEKKEKKKRKVIRTGYRSEAPRVTAQRVTPPQQDSGSLYQRRLTEIDAELAPLVIERDALLALIELVEAPAANGNGRKKARR